MMRNVMDVQGVSEYLGLGITKVYQLIEKKEIPASKIGKQYRFLRPAIDAWLMRNINMKDQDFFDLMTAAQQDFLKAGYSEKDIENAIKEVRQKKQSRS